MQQNSVEKQKEDVGYNSMEPGMLEQQIPSVSGTPKAKKLERNIKLINMEISLVFLACSLSEYVSMLVNSFFLAFNL